MLLTELEVELRNIIPHCKRLRDIRVESYDQAGVVQQVKIRDTKGWHTITAAQLRSACKNVRGLLSLCFTIMRQGNLVTISGKGHGHHMGLCQWGACKLVKRGWSYKRVLQFYYPNTTFMKLTRVE